MSITQAYEKYKQERLEREKEQQAIQQFQADAKTQTDAYFAAKKPKPHITRERHTCDKCKQTIPTGSKVTTKLQVVNGCSNFSKNNGHFERLYTCPACHDKEVVPA
jgi:hypothetical protein